MAAFRGRLKGAPASSRIINCGAWTTEPWVPHPCDVLVFCRKGGKPQTSIGPVFQARAGRSAQPSRCSTSEGSWRGVSSAGSCARAASARVRRAVRLSTASTGSAKTCPKDCAAWRAIASSVGRPAELCSSCCRLVTAWSAMPQGTMSAKSFRSVVTLKAKPWEVMPRAT